ncbi:MAG: Gfo/Idh/MocA family oxidoreductase [Daejeonella sp.]|uniref:Gfo/Idh/MocA family protein n=1 Tax=Daejeonella sp. TaxID=2805397 RepID=UPI002732C2DD|nr:Gfo/Idh/MocA family oxidoreductase [Daejeonella sp.]MDP3467835.1 Gfo/Idh/MocA family oxidoreductase [Daejeonella sp.]
MKNNKRHQVLKKSLGLAAGIGVQASASAATNAQKEIKVGVIGLSVHSAAYTEIINSGAASPEFSGCRVVAIFHPKGNPDVEFSEKSLQSFTDTITGQGVEFVMSIRKLLKKVDAVMLLTNDGRPHLKEIMPVLKAGKPVYVDKPLAASLSDVLAIFNEVKKYNVPMFSCSPLRYVKEALDIREGKVVGKVLGANTYGPAPIQKSHADLFWDGIHAVESLYTVMGGTGCKSVSRTSTEDADVVVGTWENDRIGVFRGVRKGRSGFGGTAFGDKGIASIGVFNGYRPLVVAIVEFFRSGRPPVSDEETIEIYAFMEAADESKRLGGVPVSLSDVLSKAKMK